MSQRLETPNADYEYNNGLLIITLVDDSELSVDDIRMQRETAFSFHKGEPHVVLAIAGQRTTASEEARKFASTHIPKGRIAEAVLIRSLSVRILANFYLKFHKPDVPTRMFDRRENAMTWLKGKLEEARKKMKAERVGK